MTDTIITADLAQTSGIRRYTPLAQGLHWFTALCMLAILPIGWVMMRMPDTDPARNTWFTAHKSLGITILALTILRILWRAISPPPILPGTLAKWERQLATITHWLLYFILFAMPISGYLLSAAVHYPINFFWIFQLPLIPENKPLSEAAAKVHLTMQWLVYALIALHVLGAAWHVFLRRDGLLDRMLPRQINAD
jgi:cytochrome b561